MAKRSLTIAGHRTSISLEQPFWDALNDIATERNTSVSALIAAIDKARSDAVNLSAAVRIFVLDRYRSGTATAAARSPAAGRASGPRERG